MLRIAESKCKDKQRIFGRSFQQYLNAIFPYANTQTRTSHIAHTNRIQCLSTFHFKMFQVFEVRKCGKCLQ